MYIYVNKMYIVSIYIINKNIADIIDDFLFTTLTEIYYCL